MLTDIFLGLILLALLVSPAVPWFFRRPGALLNPWTAVAVAMGVVALFWFLAIAACLMTSCGGAGGPIAVAMVVPYWLIAGLITLVSALVASRYPKAPAAPTTGANSG